jgi:hypothetical protein
MANPYEPPRPESEAPSTPRAARPDACHRCGTVLPPALLLYNENGQVTCQSCLLAAQASAGLNRVAAKVKSVAYSAPAVGLVSFVFNPMWMLSAAAILNGFYVFRALTEPENRERLAESARMMRAAAVTGIVLGGLSALLRVGVGYYHAP